MALIDWSAQFSVHQPDIDSEHQFLISIINDLYEAMKSGKGNEVLGSTLQKLIKYTEEHFSHEETLLQKYNYPSLTSHKQEHKQFTDKINDFYKSYKDGTISLSIEIIYFLKDWLVKHIQGTDQKYAEFLQSHKN